jgi:two-component system chemotaxis response regulator CheB
MTSSGIVVIGASAGGVEVLKQIVAGLPSSIPAPVFVALHVPANGVSFLPTILERSGELRAMHPQGEIPIECGRIYIAPPNHHLIVERGFVRTSLGPRENGHRPSIDVLFRSAAISYPGRVVGVILSGNLDDGTKGLVEVTENGGLAIVQDPSDADYPAMPLSALANVSVDYLAPAHEIAGAILAALDRLQRQESVCDEPPMPTPAAVLDLETRPHASEPGVGRPSMFSCPDCGGVLVEYRDGRLAHYRCRVGHAWSPESLIDAKKRAVEEALWTAHRALKERADLSRRVAARASERGNHAIADRFLRQAQGFDAQADVILGGLLDESTND